jgi:hypothetical protein
VLAACSPDQSTAPARAYIPSASLDLLGNPNAGQAQVCKTGNAGTFSIAFSGTSFTAGQVNTSAGALTATATPGTYNLSLAAGQCVIIYTRPVVAGVTSDPNVTAVVTENAGPTLLSVTVSPPDVGGPTSTASLATRSATLVFNMFHDAIATFNNAPPVTTGCTYTKGWYRNNGEETIIAVDGRTIGQVETIFDATPGQPDGVTWPEGQNDVLNLYQQLLAALQNLGGDANEDNGPAAVDAAIDAAQNGTGGTGLNITTTLTQEQISDLIEVLSAFNEGEFAGWPHCDD